MDLLPQLPFEVVSLIAEILPTADICSCMEVCSQWSQYFGQSVRKSSPLGLSELDLAKRFPEMQELDLGRTAGRPSTEDLCQLAHLVHLRTLSLRGCSSTASLLYLHHLTGRPAADFLQSI